MGAITVLRPAGVGNLMSDDNDGSWITQDPSNTYYTHKLSTFTIPAGDRVEWVRFRHRGYHPTDNTPGNFDGTILIQLGRAITSVNGTIGWNTSEMFYPTGSYEHGTTIQTVTWGQHPTTPAGGAWLQADVDALIVKADPWGGGAGTRLVEIWVDVSVNRRPVVSGITPTNGSTVTQSRPTYTWAFTDADGDTQQKYEIKVYKLADTPTPDPDVTTPWWTSGQNSSSSASKQQSKDFTSNGSYKVYIRASQAWSLPGGEFWSAWVGVTLNVTVSQPSTPVLNTSVENDKGRVVLKASSLAAAAELVVIERSPDAVNWTVVRSADNVAKVGTSMWFYDYESPPGVLMAYRAYVVDTAGGARAASAFSPIAYAEWDTDRNWIKDPLDPTKNVQVRDATFEFSIRKPQTRHDILNRTNPVVVHEGIKGMTGTLSLWSMSKAEFDKLQALLGMDTMLYQNVLGQQWYLAVGDSMAHNLLKAAPLPEEKTPIRHMYSISFPVTEVDAP